MDIVELTRLRTSNFNIEEIKMGIVERFNKENNRTAKRMTEKEAFDMLVKELPSSIGFTIEEIPPSARYVELNKEGDIKSPLVNDSN